jgi:transposase
MESDDELMEIRREFDRIRASTGKPIFPAPLRARAVTWYNARKAEGRSAEQICRTLGVGSNSMRRWIEEKHTVPHSKRMRPTSKAAFVPVAVAPTAIPATSERALRVIGPGGIRIEGLDVGSLADLLRRLA